MFGVHVDQKPNEPSIRRNMVVVLWHHTIKWLDMPARDLLWIYINTQTSPRLTAEGSSSQDGHHLYVHYIHQFTRYLGRKTSGKIGCDEDVVLGSVGWSRGIELVGLWPMDLHVPIHSNTLDKRILDCKAFLMVRDAKLTIWLKPYSTTSKL